MELGRKARSATLWSAVQQIGVNGVNTVFTLVFARFLVAEDFGIFAAGILVITFMTRLALVGLETVIVQRETMDRRVLSTGFWVALAAALVMAGLASGLGATFLPELGGQSLTLLMPCLALGMVANVIAAVIGAHFRRNLDIDLLTKRTLLAGVIGGVAAIPLAVLGFGVWTLVFHFVATSTLSAIIAFVLARGPIGLVFDASIAGDLIRRGLPILFADILKYLNTESPRIFVALFLSIEALGIFTLATRILTLMSQLTLAPLSMIGIPVFAEVNRADRARLPDLFAMALKAFLVLFLPVLLVAILLIDGLVRLLLGADWSGVALPAMVLLGGALMLPLPFVCESLLVATGKTRAYLGFTIARALVGIACLLVLAPFGILYAAAAFVLRGVLVEPALLVFTARGLGLNLRPLLTNVTVMYGAAIAVAAAAYWFAFTQLDLRYLAAAAIAVGVFALGYVAAMRLLAPGNMSLVVQLLGRR